MYTYPPSLCYLVKTHARVVDQQCRGHRIVDHEALLLRQRLAVGRQHRQADGERTQQQQRAAENADPLHHRRDAQASVDAATELIGESLGDLTTLTERSN